MATDFSYEYEGQTLNYTIIDEDARTCMTKAGYINPASSAPIAGNIVSGDLVIPSVAKDGDKEYTVVSLGEYSFGENTGQWLNSVFVPPTVTSVASNVFDLSNPEKVAYPETINNALTKDDHAIIYDPDTALIEDGILYSDSNKTLILFVPTSLSGHFTVPESVQYIYHSSFKGCTELTSIDIPDSVIAIDYSAFEGCINLTSLDIDFSSSLMRIGSNAFRNCRSLRSFLVPPSVSYIGAKVFDSCYNLKIAYPNRFSDISGNVTIPYDPTDVAAENGVLYNKDKSVLYFVPSSVSGNFIIPESVTIIARCAFFNCTDLTSVEIPDKVTDIGESAFWGCSSLTAVTIPNSVTKIWKYAFYNCTQLTSAVIGDSVTTIGENAFYNCKGLKFVLIGKSVTEIGNLAFFNCESVTKSAYPNTISSPFDNGLRLAYNPDGSEIDNGILYGKNKTKILFVPLDQSGHFTIPETVTSIGGYAFWNCTKLTSVELGNSVTTIGKNAFENCKGLNSVLIGKSVTEIGEYAFRNCESLVKSTYPNTISKPFSDGIKIAYDPDGTEIDNGILYGKNKTEILFVPLDLYGHFTIPETVTSIGEYAFCECTGLTSVKLGNSTTAINDYAFKGCTGLASVDIPKSVTYLSGFTGCTGLTSIDIPDAVTTIGDYAFSECSGLTSVEIPNSVTEIKSGAFDSCTGLRSLDLGNSVTSIGDYAFKGCTGLASVDIPNSVTYLSGFTCCTGLTSIDIPDAVTTIGNYAFYECSGLTSVEIPNSVAEIKYGAFAFCTGLKSLDLGNSVTSIGDHAFHNCTGLTSVDIPNSVTYLSGFDFCIGLTSIKMPDAVTTIGNSAFSYCYQLTSIDIPNSVTTIGSGAFSYCFLSSVKFGSSITIIGDYAFMFGLWASELVLPPKVKTIGYGAFFGDDLLESLTMGPEIKSIGDYAFGGGYAKVDSDLDGINDYTDYFNCSELKTIRITAKECPEVGKNDLSNNDITFYVQGLKDSYKYPAIKDPAIKDPTIPDNIIEMVVPTEMTLEGAGSIQGRPGDKVQLTATLAPENVTLPYIFWRSTNTAVATVDHNGLVTIKAYMDEDAEPCEIIAESLYRDAPVVKVPVNTVGSRVENTVADNNGEIDYTAPYQVYSLSGSYVGSEVGNLNPGIYIIRQGATVKKVAIN